MAKRSQRDAAWQGPDPPPPDIVWWLIALRSLVILDNTYRVIGISEILQFQMPFLLIIFGIQPPMLGDPFSSSSRGFRFSGYGAAMDGPGWVMDLLAAMIKREVHIVNRSQCMWMARLEPWGNSCSLRRCDVGWLGPRDCIVGRCLSQILWKSHPLNMKHPPKWLQLCVNPICLYIYIYITVMGWD